MGLFPVLGFYGGLDTGVDSFGFFLDGVELKEFHFLIEIDGEFGGFLAKFFKYFLCFLEIIFPGEHGG